MMQLLYKDKKESGIVLILLTISITAIIGFIGLAIDIGSLYRTELRVQKAADAGSLAAIFYRINHATLNPGDTDKTPTDAEVEARSKEIAVNNLLISGTNSPSNSNIVDTGTTDTDWDDTNRKMLLTVRETAQLFLVSTFIKHANTSLAIQTIRAEAELGRANISLVIDISGSMACPDDSDAECECRLDDSCVDADSKMKALQLALTGSGSTEGFLDKFNATRDRINIVPFNMGSRLLRSVRKTDGVVRTGFDTNPTSGPTGIAEVETLVNGLIPTSATNLSDGLLTAFEDYSTAKNTAGNPFDEEVFYVVFSDGAPTAARTFFLSRGSDAGAFYYQNFAIDFVDADGDTFKGVSQFVRHVPFETSSTLSLFNRETTDLPATPTSGEFGSTATLRNQFACGTGPVQGCVSVDEEGNFEIDEGLCAQFDAAFQGATNCSQGNLKFSPRPTGGTLTGATDASFRSQYSDIYQHFFNSAVVVSDLIRQNNGIVYVVGLGPEDPDVDTTTDPYQNEFDSFYRKDFFLNRIAQDLDGGFAKFADGSAVEFNFEQYLGEDIETTATDRQGDYLPTTDANELSKLYLKIAQKILIKLVR